MIPSVNIPLRYVHTSGFRVLNAQTIHKRQLSWGVRLAICMFFAFLPSRRDTLHVIRPLHQSNGRARLPLAVVRQPSFLAPIMPLS